MKFRTIQFVLLIIVAPLLVSCVPDSNSVTPQPTVTFTVIASGDYTISGLPENRKIELFSDQASFNSSLYLYMQPNVEYTVDFSSRRVALLSMGVRNRGGYSIEAEAIEDYGEYIKLKVLLTKPGNNCITTQAITSPYQFIEIESVSELVVDERVVTMNCAQ